MTDDPQPVPVTQSSILFYQTEEGSSRIEVKLEEGTVWLSQVMIAELYQTTRQNISLHIRNIFDEGELSPAGTVKQYLTVQTGGVLSSRIEEHRTLDISGGI